MKFSIAHLLPVLLATAACTTTSQLPHNSANVYRSSETARELNVRSCKIVQSRYVAIVGDSEADLNRDLANQAVAIVAGGLIGRAIGNEIGGGDGQKLARNLGTIGGGVAGNAVAENINAERRTRTGVEYTVDMGGHNYRTIVQELNPGEAPYPSGMSCQVTGSGVNLRVRGT